MLGDGRTVAEGIQARSRALERFAAWNADHPCRLDPGVAVAGVATLYELLPAASRRRPVDTSGIRAFHQALMWASRR